MTPQKPVSGRPPGPLGADRGVQHKLRLMESLRHALRAGRPDDLARLLQRRVTLTVDGGGLVTAPVEPITGRAGASTMLMELCGPSSSRTSLVVSANAEPALMLCDDGRVAAILLVRASRGRAREVWLVLNPEKLRHWTAPQP